MTPELIKTIIQEQQAIRLPTHLVPRTIWEQFEPLQKNNQIIILKGMRRCGKSTFIHYARSQCQEPHYYFNFDDDRLINFKIEHFQLLLESLIELLGTAKIVFFDEIQNIHGWERFIRRLHDQGYKVYLTGSNAHLFSREMGTHLTGRYISLEIYPYSFQEYLAYEKKEWSPKQVYTTEEKSTLKAAFNRYFEFGGIPDYLEYKQPEYLSDLYESILYRDIIVRNKVSKEETLKSLIYYLASHVGKDVSYNKLKDLLKLSNSSTVSDYCSYLEDSYLCYFINRYSASLKVQAHYGKKEYFVDQALAMKVGFRTSADKGRMLENIIFMELKRRGHTIYFHRDKKECDFVIKENHQITRAIQVTTHLTDEKTKQREYEGLREAMQSYHLNQGLILTEDMEYQDGNVTVLPIWKWLLLPYT